MMKFNIYETRHLISQHEMKVITQVCPTTAKGIRVKHTETDEWTETNNLYFTRYVKTYTGGFGNPTDNKIGYFAYECLYMNIALEKGKTRPRIPMDPYMQFIFGTVKGTSKHKIIVFKVDGTEYTQVTDIAKQHNLDMGTFCYFNLHLCADGIEEYDGKVYDFIVEDEEDKSFSVYFTEPDPGMRYICTLEEEICEKEEIPRNDAESNNADNKSIGDENGENN